MKSDKKEIIAYMSQLSKERNEHREALYRYEQKDVARYEFLDSLAETIGIDIYHENWWDNSEGTKEKQLLERAKQLHVTSVNTAPVVNTVAQTAGKEKI